MDDTSVIAGDLGEARKARASRPKQADAADRLQVPRNRTLQIGPCTDNEPPQLQSTIVLGMTRVQLPSPSRARAMERLVSCGTLMPNGALIQGP